MSHSDIDLGHDAPRTAASGRSPTKQGSLEFSQTTWQPSANKNHLYVNAVFLRLAYFYCAAFWTCVTGTLIKSGNPALFIHSFIYLAEQNLFEKLVVFIVYQTVWSLEWVSVVCAM